MFIHSTSQANRRSQMPRNVGPSDDVLGLMGATIKFGRNTEVYGEGEPVEHIYRVVSGAVRISKLLSDGRRQVTSFRFAGDTFGHEVSDTHQFCAEAIVESAILVVNRRAAMQVSERDHDLHRSLWNDMLRDLGRAQAHMLLLGRKTASEKVAAFLLDMARRSAKDGVIELPMSRYDIADYLGLTIETVSRTLTDFEGSGAIALHSARRLELRKQTTLEHLNS